MKKICEFCKKEFNADRKTRMFCSVECRTKASKKSSVINCSYCGKEFEKKNDQIKRSIKHYCSPKCRKIHQKETLKGEGNPNFKNRNIDINCSYCNKSINVLECNIKNSDGTNKKNIYCSKDCKHEHQKQLLVGENNPNYKEEKEDEIRIKERQYTGYKEWRIKVFKRDNYKCVNCNTTSTRKNRIVAHHILNHYKYPELRIDVDNGVTLCSQCHWNFHKIYGTLDNNIQQLNDFLKKEKAS